MKSISVIVTLFLMVITAGAVVAQDTTDAKSWIGKYEGASVVGTPSRSWDYQIVIERVEGNKVFATSRASHISEPRVLTGNLTGTVEGNVLSLQDVGGVSRITLTRDGMSLTGTGYGRVSSKIDLKKVE